MLLMLLHLNPIRMDVKGPTVLGDFEHTQTPRSSGPDKAEPSKVAETARHSRYPVRQTKPPACYRVE
ncbi:unnamed protein product [Knipowitschia caucasica]